MTLCARWSLLILAALLPPLAHALDKVDPYICPTKTQGSGLECFLEAIPQTYTMCRHIKHIEVIEFGLGGAQEGNHGAKTESCIEKHKLSMTRPYQAALREAARNKDEVVGVRKLYDTWLESLGKLAPATGESDEGYRTRVSIPYGEFNTQIAKIRELDVKPTVAAAKTTESKPAARPAAKPKAAPAKSDAPKQ
ncbi:MAG: hypothetical protein ABI981_08930 [Betaproteobacteria bacterium]